jgi:hypothetical protein
MKPFYAVGALLVMLASMALLVTVVEEFKISLYPGVPNTAQVAGNNVPVVPATISVTTTPNMPVTVQLTASDADSGDTLTYVHNDAPSAFVFVSRSGNNLQTYSYSSSVPGTVTFTYWVTDGKSESNRGTVTITVQNPNTPPTVQSTSVKTGAGTSLQI